MAAHEIQHPRWGSNFTNQLSAKVYKQYGTDGYKYTTESYAGFFGGQKTRVRSQYVGSDWVDTNDDNEVAKRTFRHRCGLLKIVMTPGRGGPMFVAFLDGHVTSNFVSGEMEFRFTPDDLKDNDGKPIAEVWFSGKGTRHGPLHDYGTSRIVCTFADKEQMDQYLDLTNRRMPKSITHKGVTYGATSTGTYQSDDGSILPFLLVMYFLLSSHEQQAFAAQNPEVQSMLGDSNQGAASTDGGTSPDSTSHDTTNGGTTPQEGATYDGGGNQSDGANYSGSDSGGSSSDSGGSFDSGSSSFDSGNSFSPDSGGSSF